MRIRVEPSAALTALALCVSAWELLPALGLAAAVHECGHFLALRACKAQTDSVTLSWSGVKLTYRSSLSYQNEALCAAAGPAAGAVLAVLGLLRGSGFLYEAGRMSAVLALYNLIPAQPFDGGTILRCALARRLSQTALDRAEAAAACLVSLALALTSSVFGRSPGSLAIPLLAAAWLLFSVAKSARRV